MKASGNATVLKILMDSIPGMEIDRIEIDPNHQFTGVPHTRGTKEYFFCEKGHFTIYVDGEKYLLNRGDVLIFPGDLKHSYGNREQVKSIGFSVVAFA